MSFWNLFWISLLSILSILLLILVLYYSITQDHTIKILTPILYRQYILKTFSMIGLQLIKTHYFVPDHNESMDPYVELFLKKQSNLFQSISSSCRKHDIWKQMSQFIESKNDPSTSSYSSLFIIPDVLIFKNGNEYYNLLLKYISQFLMKKAYFQELENQQAKEFLYTLFRRQNFPLSVPK
jgi:hypothetical protein